MFDKKEYHPTLSYAFNIAQKIPVSVIAGRNAPKYFRNIERAGFLRTSSAIKSEDKNITIPARRLDKNITLKENLNKYLFFPISFFFE